MEALRIAAQRVDIAASAVFEIECELSNLKRILAEEERKYAAALDALCPERKPRVVKMDTSGANRVLAAMASAIRANPEPVK
jgi:hypothetical protein